MVSRSTTFRSVVIACSARGRAVYSDRVLRADQPALAENRGPARAAFRSSRTFPRPVVAPAASPAHRASKPAGGASERLRDLLKKCVAEQHDVALALAKRRQADVEHLQTIEEILAELTALDCFPQIAVCSRQ